MAACCRRRHTARSLHHLFHEVQGFWKTNTYLGQTSLMELLVSSHSGDKGAEGAALGAARLTKRRNTLRCAHLSPLLSQQQVLPTTRNLRNSFQKADGLWPGRRDSGFFLLGVHMRRMFATCSLQLACLHTYTYTHLYSLLRSLCELWLNHTGVNDLDDENHKSLMEGSAEGSAGGTCGPEGRVQRNSRHQRDVGTPHTDIGLLEALASCPVSFKQPEDSLHAGQV